MYIKFNSFTWKDTNAAAVAITGDNRKAIQRKSLIEFSFSAESSEGPIDRYDLFISPEEPKITVPASVAKYTRAVYDKERTYIHVTAYDTKGNTTEAGGWIDILPYTSPAIDGAAARVNNFENETQLTAAASVADLGGKNTKAITYQYRKAGTASYSTATAIEEGETAVISLDNKTAWEVKFTVSDAFETAAEVVPIAKGIPIVFVDRGIRSVAVGGFPTHADALEVPALYAGGVRMQPNPPRYKSATVTAAAVNTTGQILSLSLPAGVFLVFGSVQSSIGGGSTLQSCIVDPGKNCDRLAGQQGRSSMNGGGGVTAWGVFRLSAPGTVLLKSYNYYTDNSYQWYGHAVALQLDE